MKLYIEVLIIIILILIFIIWRIWYGWGLKRLLKKYSPENDKSRKGGIFNQGRIDSAEQGTEPTPVGNDGHEQPEGRGILPKTNVSSVRKNSNSPRKNTNLIKRFFRTKN